ncbi:GyrI-like domain-containing protein [Micromonospora sp. NPDC048063]|uniref:GyrI-like domain-containing protein n=1 Tax=Micromonospora sp. NPDC048063 TaxID=3364256 RepID=UPI00371C248C
MTIEQPADVVERRRDPKRSLSIRATVPVARLAEAQGEQLTSLISHLRASGVAPAGAPFVRYHTFGDDKADLETGIPVGDDADGTDRIAVTELPGGTAISTWHLGAHDRLAEAYARLEAWLGEHQRTPAGPAWEVYTWIDPTEPLDPSAWPSPTEWSTEIVQPVRPA